MRLTSDARVWIALGLAVLLAVLLSIGRPGSEESGADELFPFRSTYRTRPTGLRALYLTLEELGYRPRRHHETLHDFEGDGTLVIVEPMIDLGSSEWEALRDWVERGNLLLLASDSGRLFEASRYRTFTPTAPATAAPVQPVPVSRGATTYVIQSAYRFDRDTWSPERGGGELTLRRSRNQPRPAPARVFPAEPVVPLYADRVGPVLSLSRWGKGTVLLSCSPWSLSNEGIARGNNLALLLNLIDAYGGGRRRPIYFDEYHHGHGGGEGPLSLVAPVARRGLLQILAALLLLVFAVSRRFGPIVPVEALERRTRAEYLTAMAVLFRRARALELVAGKLRDETQRDLARALGLPPTAQPDEIARVAQEKRGVDAERIRRTLEEADFLSVARARHLPIDEGRVLALAGKLHDLRKDVARWA